MRALLDTCAFLWIAVGDSRLSERAAQVFRDSDTEIFLSSVSAWEIALKHGLGRLPLPEAPGTLVPRLREEHGIETLPLEEAACLHLDRLPALHRDPFDRMLVCQALLEGMPVLTPDEGIAQYPVRTIW